MHCMDTRTNEGGEFAGGSHLKLDTGKIDIAVVTNDGVVKLGRKWAITGKYD